MKNVILAVKVLVLTIFGVLGALSILMFPNLIGHNDPEASLIGYFYLGLLLISVSVFYLILKKEFKPIRN
ncbi:hypothetical protein [Lacinutrix chionoecetis]